MAHALATLLEEIALWTTTNCQPFEPSIVTHLLSTTRYLTIFTMLSLYVFGIRYCELYIILFGICSTLNWVLNIVLRVIVGDKTLVVATCVDAFSVGGNWPSFQTQEAAFVTAFIASYAIMYRTRPHLFGSFVLMLFYAAVVAGDLVLNYHTSVQIIGSAAVGCVFGGLICPLVLRFFVLPLAPDLLSFRLVKYLEYRETLCSGKVE